MLLCASARTTGAAKLHSVSGFWQKYFFVFSRPPSGGEERSAPGSDDLAHKFNKRRGQSGFPGCPFFLP